MEVNSQCAQVSHFHTTFPALRSTHAGDGTLKKCQGLTLSLKFCIPRSPRKWNDISDIRHSSHE